MLPVFGIVVACAGGNAASGLAKPPEYAKDQSKCSAKASVSEPLIVEWPSAARGQLEDILENKKLIPVVRYEVGAFDFHTGVAPSQSPSSFVSTRDERSTS